MDSEEEWEEPEDGESLSNDEDEDEDEGEVCAFYFRPMCACYFSSFHSFDLNELSRRYKGQWNIRIRRKFKRKAAVFPQLISRVIEADAGKQLGGGRI